MKKSKIVFSSYDDLKNPYYAGGGASAIDKIAELLVKNFDITVLTGSYPGAIDENIHRVNFVRIGPKNMGPKLSQLVFQLLLPIYVIKMDFAVWLESFTPPFSTSCLQLFTKKPVIGLVHMLAGEDMRRKYHLPFDIVEKFGLKTYKHFITTSKSFENKIKKLVPDSRIICIPNGVDINIHHLKSSQYGHYLLFLGRIEVNQKGLDLLLKSYSQIRNTVSAKLIIAGSGTNNEISKLNRLIVENKLTGSVELVGKVEGEQKNDLICQADCIVLPSRFETFSMVALEAISCGIPLVIYDIEGLNWIPKTSSLKARAFDIQDYSQKIITAVKNKKIRRNIINNGLQYSKKFSWNKSALDYKKYINGLIHE